MNKKKVHKNRTSSQDVGSSCIRFKHLIGTLNSVHKTFLRVTLICSTTLLVLSGCKVTPVEYDQNHPELLNEITELTKDKALEKKEYAQNKIRVDAIRDTAMSFGARSGLAWRAEQINKQLLEQTAYLDKIFNFQSLMIDGGVLPPVLTEGRSTLNMQSPHSIRVADRTYKIVKQARFTTTAPMWRDYLLTVAETPKTPDATLLPKTADEEHMWKKMVKQGWEYGIEQANQIYMENLSRLKRDYQGMIRYRQLLAQNMVSAPQVAQRELGVTGGGEQMAINDRVLTIKALPALKADTQQWTPALSN